MDVQTMTLTDFLLARIAEDEAVARDATPGPWLDWGTGIRTLEGDAAVALSSDGRPPTQDEDGAHIARWDPARVLAECEAKRRIVEAYLDERTRRDIYWQADERDLNDDDRHRRHSTTARTRGLEIAVEALALPYENHPDYRDEWRP